MNFLQLAQRLRQEAGASGTGPSGVTDQLGESKRFVDWINSAWLEIQGLHDSWGFLRKQFSFSVPAGTADASPTTHANLTDFRFWHTGTLRCMRTAIGFTDEQWLVEWDYNTFRNTYRFNIQRSMQGRPVVFAVEPNTKALMLGRIPDEEYTIVGDYQSTPTSFVLSTDTPAIPEHMHMIIVYKALEYYALYESAGEVLTRAQKQYAALLSQLERDQMPVVTLGEPMA